MSTIKVNNLVVKFGDFVAVNGIDLDIKKGEIFGFLGPNGAGKTTTISVLSTILKPTSGKVKVNNFDVIDNPDEVRKSIGIVFQDQSLDEDLTAFENMDFHARMYRLDKKYRKDKILKLLELVELTDRKDDLVKNFSGGMRRRLEIARGLLHNPKILFLDEPTLGLDPQTRNHLWEYISNLNKEKGITIILTTHYMDEADKLCNRIAIIDEGKIVAVDSNKKLKQSIGGEIINIFSKNNLSKIFSSLDFSWILNKKVHKDNVEIKVKDSGKRIGEIVSKLNSLKISFDSVSMHNPSLEEVFLHFTGKTIRDQEANSKDRMRIAMKMRKR